MCLLVQFAFKKNVITCLILPLKLVQNEQKTIRIWIQLYMLYCLVKSWIKRIMSGPLKPFVLLNHG